MPDLRDRLGEALKDRYTLERELGRGGMATVWLAGDRKHDRLVALKVLHPELAHALGPERFLREIALTARLNHPHILPLHDSGVADGFLFYVMPYVEEESLRDRLDRERQLPVDEVLHIARDVADALAYAHGHGVLHRDIKPENILLAAGHAVVADFGLARAVVAAGGDTLTATGIAVGTPAYMSPEQGAAAAVDGRSDVYALGCVLYEMLAGSPPFTATGVQAILARHALAAVPSVRAVRAGVPAAVDDAIARALRKAPEERWSGAREFADALDALAAGTRGRTAPRRWIAGGALAVGAIVIAAGITALVRADPYRIATLRTLLTRSDPQLHPNRVVVAPFANATGDTTLDALGDLAADWVARGLAGVGVEVVDARTAQIASRVVQGIPRVLRRADRALAIAEETGAATAIWGSYFRSGDSLRIEGQITEVATGKLVRAIEPVSAPANEPEALVERLRRQTLVTFAVARDTAFTGLFGSGGRPPRYEAYRETSRGMESYFRQDFEDALVRLTRAVGFDSGSAWPTLALTFLLQEGHRWAQADSQLMRLRAMPLWDDPIAQAMVEFLQAVEAGETDGRLRAARELLRLAPASAEYAAQVALSALYANRPREAIAVLSRTDPERGLLLVSDVYWAVLTAVRHRLGDHERELRDARRGRRRFPAAWLSEYAELRALTALGQHGGLARRLANASLQPVRTSYPGGPVMVGIDARLHLAAELRAHGALEEAHTVARELVAQLTEGLLPDSHERRSMIAQVLYFQGRWDEARDFAEQLAHEHPDDVRHQGLLGAIAARRGDRAGAEGADSALATNRAPYLFGRASYELARIAALLGDHSGAVALLREALAQGLHVWTLVDFSFSVSDEVNLHTDVDFEHMRNDPAFLELIRPRG